MDENRQYYVFDQIEKERIKFLQSEKRMPIRDFGAGSQKKNKNKVRISQVARESLSSPWQCAMMFRLAEFLEAKYILEMGTSLGISSMYLAGNQNREVTAMEGDPGYIKIAKDLASRLHYKNLQFIEGRFDETLPSHIEQSPIYDLIFLDGHHIEAPTMSYFESLQLISHQNTVIIIDDIHWSKGMERAWHRIQISPNVTQTIDFYFFGLVFFRKSFLQKQHHVIIPTRAKPWKK